MLLYLLRHGDALQTPSLGDSERPLSDLGKRQAEAVGAFLRLSNISVDKIFTSPLVRAVETSNIVGKSIGVQTPIQTEYLVPGTRKTQLFDMLNSEKPKSALLVGHEPHLSQTVSLLLTAEENLPIEFKKCSLACLVASDPIRKGHALLQWLLAQDQLQLVQR